MATQASPPRSSATFASPAPAGHLRGRPAVTIPAAAAVDVQPSAEILTSLLTAAELGLDYHGRLVAVRRAGAVSGASPHFNTTGYLSEEVSQGLITSKHRRSLILTGAVGEQAALEQFLRSILPGGADLELRSVLLGGGGGGTQRRLFDIGFANAKAADKVYYHIDELYLDTDGTLIPFQRDQGGLSDAAGGGGDDLEVRLSCSAWEQEGQRVTSEQVFADYSAAVAGGATADAVEIKRVVFRDGHPLVSCATLDGACALLATVGRPLLTLVGGAQVFVCADPDGGASGKYAVVFATHQRSAGVAVQVLYADVKAAVTAVFSSEVAAAVLPPKVVFFTPTTSIALISLDLGSAKVMRALFAGELRLAAFASMPYPKKAGPYSFRVGTMSSSFAPAKSSVIGSVKLKVWNEWTKPNQREGLTKAILTCLDQDPPRSLSAQLGARSPSPSRAGRPFSGRSPARVVRQRTEQPSTAARGGAGAGAGGSGGGGGGDADMGGVGGDGPTLAGLTL